MDTSDSSPTEDINVGKESSLLSPKPQEWSCTGDKLKDDLNLFITGSFYDCTFRVSNDVTSESEVNIFNSPHILLPLFILTALFIIMLLLFNN
jgi:hypothetical protein